MAICIMRRAPPALAISPKVFRHIAMLTVAITGCIGMFADGESRQAITDTIARRQMHNSALAAEAGKRHVGMHNLKLGEGRKAVFQIQPEIGDGGGVDTGSSIDPDTQHDQRAAYAPRPGPVRCPAAASPVSVGRAAIGDATGSPPPVPIGASARNSGGCDRSDPPQMAGASDSSGRMSRNPAGPTGRPSPEQLKSLMEASMRRSGSTDAE